MIITRFVSGLQYLDGVIAHGYEIDASERAVNDITTFETVQNLAKKVLTEKDKDLSSQTLSRKRTSPIGKISTENQSTLVGFMTITRKS